MPKPNALDCGYLASQTIDEHGPGSILMDFEALLGFVEGGVRSTGKYHMLPMARLFELDQRMTKPLRPRLKRPQQKSFPHLNGLYWFVARDGRQIDAEHPDMDEAEMHTDEVAIGELPLDERQSMQFQYDFGADWRFDVQLEKIEPAGAKISKPTIVESRGKAPAEYESYDEW